MLEVGDKVKIRPRLSAGREYNKVLFIDEMKQYRGKIATIKNKIWNSNCYIYNIDLDDGDWNWSEEMFEKYEEPTNEEVNTQGITRDDLKMILDEQVSMFSDILDSQKQLMGRQVGANTEKLNENTNAFNEMKDSIKKLTDKIDKRTLYDDSMLETAKKKVEEISVGDLVEKINKKVDNYISKNYGKLPTQSIEINNGNCVKKIDGIFHKTFEEILKIVNKNVPLMLTGPAGAGKNHTLEQVAEALGLPFLFTNAVTQEYKLTGFIDANGVYQETQFYKAFKDGGLFFLDEVDASVPEALITLNAAIANGYFDFPCGRVNANENFRCVCAGNTYGTGADMVYVGRNVLDGATLDRFVVIDFDYDENIEKQLAYDDELYNFIKAMRKAIKKNSLRYIVSMRATINASKLLEVGIPKKDILISVIIKNMQIDDLNILIDDIKDNSEWKDLLQEIVNDRNK